MVEGQKKVDESWKDRVDQEKQQPAVIPVPGAPPAAEPSPKPAKPTGDELPEARFDLFISGLAMDALISLGDVPHPVTKKQSVQLEHARYLVDVLGVLAEKTKGNLSVDEDRLLKDTLYQLRMRYLAKSNQ